MIDIDYLKQLLDIFDESTVNDLRIDKEGASIRLTKNPKKESADGATYHYLTPPAAPMQTPLAPVAEREHAVAAPTQNEVNAAAQSKAEHEAAAAGHTITSPIVGTFYSSPSPDSDPFVEVGSRVSKGQVLCIIEAMKLMNEIESDVDGTVAQIYPQNAQAVEFGEPLFVIRT